MTITSTCYLKIKKMFQKRKIFKNLKCIIVIIIFFSSCSDNTNFEILSPNFFKHYIKKFNQNDNYLYPQYIKNDSTFKFLSENIPIIEIPNKEIEETYYFRWWTYRKHIKSTVDGFVITEFLPKVYWSGKHNTINYPAGHHLYEGRWLKNSKFIEDYINFWLYKSEGGLRQYSFWIADAVLAFHKVHRNDSILSYQLEALINNYNNWEKIRRDEGNIMFWQSDGLDGEFSISGRILNNGVEIPAMDKISPSINSYMYGDARAISKISSLLNDSIITKKFESKASIIKQQLQNRLWNKKLNFFGVLPRNYNNNSQLVNVRELLGYIPWYFNLPDDNPKYRVAWKKLKDTTGFLAPYGLTVAERSHPFFKISYEGHECQWNGPSWPYSTSQTLKALSNYLNNYSKNKSISKDDYYPLLLQYARSHKILNEKGGKQNWIDENINPFTGDWISRTRLKTWENGTWSEGKGGKERGKDYNHSSFCDLILSDLLGIKLSIDNIIEISPLIPENWDWFAVDNIYYQGKSLSLVWDKTGKKYNLGKGLMLFLENKIISKANKIEKISFVFDK